MDIPIFAIFNSLRKYINWKEVMRLPKWINSLRCPIKVVVYGESGVGKTQFVKTITESHEYVKIRTRDISRGHMLCLSNGRRVEFIDTPGQSSYKQKRNELKSLFKSGNIQGVVNLVAYGYLSKPETRESDVFKVGTNDVKAKFLRDNQESELEQAKELIQLIAGSKNVKWILHVINKADLWYGKEQEVTEYYELHEYRNNVIDPLSVNRKWKLLPFCSMMTTFVKRSLPHAIDEETKDNLHKTLMNDLEELALS